MAVKMKKKSNLGIDKEIGSFKYVPGSKVSWVLFAETVKLIKIWQMWIIFYWLTFNVNCIKGFSKHFQNN
jgi:hypothetical protein